MIKRNSDLIILSIIWILSIISIITAIIASQNLGVHIYLSYIFLLIISILRYFKVKGFKIYLAIFLVLGMIGLIQFSQFFWTTEFGMSFRENGINTVEFHTLFLILIIYFILANFGGISGIITDIFSENINDKIERQRRTTDKYYEELKLEKNEKLQDIIDNKNIFQVEYYRAAKKLLEERNNN
jgi:hypothetical protein